MSLNIPKEIENKDRDKSPNLGEDQMSGCSSSAMCGFEFPENNLGQMVSCANQMLSERSDTVSVGSMQVPEKFDPSQLALKPQEMSVIMETYNPEMEQSPCKIKKRESSYKQLPNRDEVPSILNKLAKPRLGKPGSRELSRKNYHTPQTISQISLVPKQIMFMQPVQTSHQMDNLRRSSAGPINDQMGNAGNRIEFQRKGKHSTKSISGVRQKLDRSLAIDNRLNSGRILLKEQTKMKYHQIQEQQRQDMTQLYKQHLEAKQHVMQLELPSANQPQIKYNIRR